MTKTSRMNSSVKSKTSDAMHVVMRYSDKYGVNTIQAHEEILKTQEKVLIGKVGKSLADGKIRSLSQQIESGIPSYFFLAKRIGPGKYEVYQGKMEGISTEVATKDKHLIPSYYQVNGIIPFVELWIKVSSLSLIESKQFSQLSIISTGKNLLETLPKSVISLFMVSQV